MTRHLEELGLPRTGVPLLRDLIHERTGLYYADARYDTLCERLAPLVVDRGFRSYLDLYYLLKYDANAAEWTRLMDALAVPETYFWREIDQIRAVIDHAVPVLARQQPEAPLRIWSAPCASGEEPLTIAMLLEEAGWFNRHPIEIYGSDGSGVAIDRARTAIYRERSFRSTPPCIREKYFTPAPGGWQAAEPLRARVRGYSVLNLMDRLAIAPYASSPIVFCRNAFIYFSSEAVQRAVSNLATLMPDGGILCLGASESLLNMATPFRLEELDGAFVYVKS